MAEAAAGPSQPEQSVETRNSVSEPISSKKSVFYTVAGFFAGIIALANFVASVVVPNSFSNIIGGCCLIVCILIFMFAQIEVRRIRKASERQINQVTRENTDASL